MTRSNLGTDNSNFEEIDSYNEKLPDAEFDLDENGYSGLDFLKLNKGAEASSAQSVSEQTNRGLKFGVLGLALLLILGIGGIRIFSVALNAVTLIPKEDTIEVIKGDVSEEIVLSGAVAPERTASLSARNPGRIEEIFVKKGDLVEKDQLLAKIDLKEMQDEAALKSAEGDLKRAESRAQLDQALRVLQDAQQNADSGLDPQTVQAQAGVDDANSTLEAARLAYEKARGMTTSDKNPQLVELENQANNAKSEVLNARLQLLRATFDLNNNLRNLGGNELVHDDQSALEIDSLPLNALSREEQIQLAEAQVQKALALENYQLVDRPQLEGAIETSMVDVKQSEALLQSAEDAEDFAEKNLQAALTGVNDDVLEARQNLDSAEKVKQNSEIALQSAIYNADRMVRKAESSVELAEDVNEATGTAVNAENSLMASKLLGNEIRAPFSGMVTGLLMTEGMQADGPVLTMEGLQQNYLKLSVREADYRKVKKGDKVSFTTQSTGKELFSGEVSAVAPAISSAGIASNPSQNVEGGGVNADDSKGNFEVRVNIKDQVELPIGTNAEAKILINRAEDVAAIPQESTFHDDQGVLSVLVIEKTEDLDRIAKRPVRLGIKSVYDAEVVEGLSEGEIVIRNPEEYMDKIDSKATVTEK